jgi:hypothetical protein
MNESARVVLSFSHRTFPGFGPTLRAVLNKAGSSLPVTRVLEVIRGVAAGLGTYKDVTYGICLYAGFRASQGWDVCTGLGAPRNFSGH